MEKPNWTFNELNDKYKRWSDLIHETDKHAHWCDCTQCTECLELDELMSAFSEDEHATAVIRMNQGRGGELVNPKLESEFHRV